jgi:putative ABC transport system substrate-binding protein
MQFDHLKRREFITLLGGAATWPLSARAQQPAMPVIGLLSSGSLESDAPRLIPFRQGLNEIGFVEGRNVAIEYRGMQGHYDLLPAFLAEFIRRSVAVIVTNGSTPAALAAKGATSTIPIVFNIGLDPVQSGVVPSFNRPGGNVTGVSNLAGPLAAKRLELLHELMPGVALVAVLVNPTNPSYLEYETAEARKAADSLGLRLHILNASTAAEIDAAFATLPQVLAGAFLISSEFFFISRQEQLAALAARYAVPAISGENDFTTAGGLMSYAEVQSEINRQWGIYVGRILKGEKPADLPVQTPTKYKLAINVKTAKALGLTVPPSILLRADEIIE